MNKTLCGFTKEEWNKLTAETSSYHWYYLNKIGSCRWEDVVEYETQAKNKMMGVYELSTNMSLIPLQVGKDVVELFVEGEVTRAWVQLKDGCKIPLLIKQSSSAANNKDDEERL